MKQNFTIRSLFRTACAWIALFALLPRPAQAQLSVAATNTPYTITFDATMAGVNNDVFAGTGFDAVPATGQLNSNAWASTGMSYGPSVFGGTNTTDDFARGAATGTVTTGGFYAFTGVGSSSLGIKPGSNDWTPGTLTLRVQNTTGANLTSLDVAYELWNNNSQGRSNSFNFSWSTDDASYIPVPTLNFTSPATADANGYVVSNKSTTITGLSVANNGYIYLRWSGDDVDGIGSRDEFALDDINVTGHGAGGPNTSIEFVSTSGSIAENAGTTSLTVAITAPSTVNSTSVDVVLTGGNAARIGNYTTQTITFPPDDGEQVAVAFLNLTITDNDDCDGDATLNFQLQNITGGQGTPYIGASNAFALEVQDNEAPADPVTTAGTAIASDGFTANWNAVNGATNYYLDVYSASATSEEDFTDGDFTSTPAWTGSTGNYGVLTNATLPGGTASTDASFLGSNESVGSSALLMPSTETSEWKFSWGSSSFSGSNTNHFGVVLMSDAAISSIDDAFNGYYLRVGVNSNPDPIELWRSTGTTKAQVGAFPASPDYNANALRAGLDVRVTRSASGTFELFQATGFTYTATPATSAGTLTDNTYSSSSYFGVYTSFANPAAFRRVYIDNIVLGGAPAFVPGYENFNAGTATSAMITGLNPLTTYHYVVRSTGGCSTGENSNETDVTTLAGTNPAFTAGNLADFGAPCLGAEGGPNSFNLQGFNLTTADVTIGTLDGFSYSTTELGTYTTSLSISQPGGSFNQDIWVKFNPTLEQSYNGNISVGGGGAPSVDVAATGSGINTAASMTTGSTISVGSDQAEVAGTIADQGCSALTEYGIEYSTTADFTPGTGTPVASTNESGGNYSSVLTGLTPCTTYYFVAYGTNNGGTTYGTQGSFETGPIAPTTATAATAINSEDFTANWDALGSATGYRLDVSTLPLFGNMVNASDLFFSEYVEGSSNNKYVEVYNGTGTSVDLSNYALQIFTNGAPSVSVSDTLIGTLANGSTIVFANSGATAYTGTVTVSSAVNFNGDDAFALRNIATASYADIIGTIDEDPGSQWTGADGRSTANKTLVRNADVHGGVTSNPVTGFPTLDTEWAVYDQDDVSHLGTHDFNNLVPSFVPGYEDLAVAGTSQLVAGLNTNTTYYYRVRAESGACVSGNSNTISVTTLPCLGNAFKVSIQTDDHGDQITWEVVDENDQTIATGGPYPGQDNTLITETVCIGTTPVSACFGFRIYDSFGDGITGGNWQIRTMAGKLLLRDDFDAGYISPSFTPLTASYGTSHSFCLPEGAAMPANNECGVFNNGLGNKVYSTTVPGATQYEFEFSDPDAGFVRRVTSTHNNVHFWDIPAPGLTPGVKYFARVRTNANGPLADAHFGKGCQMGLGIPVVVRCSELISAPAYGHSCNETRAFGTNNSFIYAKPVTGATEYQYRIYIPGESYDTVITRSTYILQLKWNGNPLENGSTYNVQVQVKVNGLLSGFCPSSCTISIANPGGRPLASIAQAAFAEAALWPNPVHNGALHLSIEGLVDAEQQIAVDVQDIYGKQVFSKEYGNSGDRFTTVLDMPSDLATGVYMVNITVNGERTVQRLSVVR